MAALLCLYVTLRVLQSLSSTGSFDDEDGWTLAAAWELIHGRVSWPYQAYQLSDWECGTRLMVYLAVPFVLLFGPSVLALKLTGLVVSTITLAGCMLLCRHMAGLAGAVVVAVLYSFFSAPVATYSVTAHGFHPDSFALQVFFLWLMARAYDSARAPGRRRLFLIGALGGFSVYFAYISVIGVLAGVLPWLWLALRRRARHPFPLWPLAAGGAAGSLPLWLYNALNEGRGLRSYHGSLPSYLSPTDLARKLEWFEERTYPFMRHFANPSGTPEGPGGELLEEGFWILALCALCAPPLIHFLLRALRWPPGEGSPLRAGYLDAVGPLFVALTLGIFITSAHPVGPMHVVPLLVLLTCFIAARLATVARHGGLSGKALAAGVLGFFLTAAVPDHLMQIEPGRLDAGLATDGRNYPLFLYRARDVYDLTGDKRRLDAVRDMLMVLPFELAENDEENMIHHGVVGLVVGEEPIKRVRDFVRHQPFRVEADHYRVSSLALMSLYIKEQINSAQLTGLLEGWKPGDAATMLETLSFHMDPGTEQRNRLYAAVLESPALRAAGAAALARGLGRRESMRVMEPPRTPVCRHPSLRPAQQRDFARGLGRGLVRRLVRPVPSWAGEAICPDLRADFWQGVKGVGPPTEVVLRPDVGM